MLTVSIAFIFLSLTNPSGQDDKWPVPDKYMKMKNPYAGEKDAEQNGKRLFAMHCRSCHGTKGKGDGTKAAELKTKVPDLTASQFKAQPDGAIYYKTVFGKGDMPGFDKKIKEEEDRWLIINYVKSLN